MLLFVLARCVVSGDHSRKLVFVTNFGKVGFSPHNPSGAKAALLAPGTSWDSPPARTRLTIPCLEADPLRVQCLAAAAVALDPLRSSMLSRRFPVQARHRRTRSQDQFCLIWHYLTQFGKACKAYPPVVLVWSTTK